MKAINWQRYKDSERFRLNLGTLFLAKLNCMSIIKQIAILLAVSGWAWSGPALGAVNTPLQDFQAAVTRAVAAVRPAVVSIKALKKKGAEAGGFIWMDSIGSGFIVDKRGYILTNHHVVDGAEDIKVSLWRPRNNKFAARVVHTDKSLDLSVLKIDGRAPLTPARLGNSDRIETTDWVISVGSPYGFEHSVSLGIVSDLNRNLLINEKAYRNMIQTDAVINEGNSGGPLVDIRGNVVGVGTAIFAPQGSYTGMGFAIPINRARHFFTRVTGAKRVALTAPAPGAGNKEPINLNSPLPRDRIHRQFTDCTQCHTISKRMAVTRKAAIPHPMVGACDKCHILTNGRRAKGPVTVAHAAPAPPTEGGRGLPALSIKLVLKLIPMIMVVAILFTMLGVGGGFLYVPILLSCGIDFHTAATTSLVMLTTAQASALFVFFRSGLVALKLAVLLELPTMIGAFLGGMLSSHFHVGILVVMFACALFAASYFLMQDRLLLQWAGNGIRISPWQVQYKFRGHSYSVDMMPAGPLMLGVGFLGGLLGLGGGWLKVPIMVMLFGLPMKVAIATSALMVPMTGFAGFLGHSMIGHFEPQLALYLSVITVLGAQIGSRISIKAENNLLQFIFAFVLSLVGLWMIIMVL